MRFRVEINEIKWNGKSALTGKCVKQKTFTADGWDEAEAIADRIFNDFQDSYGKACDVALTVIK